MTVDPFGSATPGPEHPARATALSELHARPAPRVETGGHVTRLVFMPDGGDETPGHRSIDAICTAAGASAPSADARYHAIFYEGRELRWERHTEFITYTFVSPGDGRSASVWDRLNEAEDSAAKDAHASHGRLLALIAITVHAAPAGVRCNAPDTALSGSACASVVADGRARIATNFRADAHGFVAFDLTHEDLPPEALPPEELGTLCQSLLDMETYRMLALIALPLARRIGGLMHDLEAQLGIITQRVEQQTDGQSSEPVFGDLTRLSAQIETEIAAVTYRFSAALAYGAIVEDRLRGLGERPCGGLPLVGAFLTARLTPAMRTCASMQNALATLAQRCSRTSDLLRTRIDLQLARQNNALLGTLNQRTRMQMRLQQTVEGLSVAAISYYIVGLVGYLMKGAKDAGVVSVDPAIAMAASVPVIVVVVAAILLRIRRTHTRHD